MSDQASKGPAGQAGSSNPELQLILARDGRNRLRLWACRGEGKGCERNKHRNVKTNCPDCFGPLNEKWTLAQVIERLKQGDA